MRDTLLADRIRCAACIALRQERGPLGIAELVVAITRMGIPIPSPANKTVSDLLRCEVRRHHRHVPMTFEEAAAIQRRRAQTGAAL